MSRYIDKRVLEEASYILETKNTVRNLSKHFKISKSTIHKDLHERLRLIDLELYEKVQKIFDDNYNQKHIRGGLATKRKYASL